MIPEITKSCMYIFNNFHLLKAILGKIRLLFLWEYWMGVRFLFIIEVVDIHSVCNSWYRPFVPMKPSTLPFRQSALGVGPSYGNGGSLQTFAQQSLNQFQMPKVVHKNCLVSVSNKAFVSVEWISNKSGHGPGHLSQWSTATQGRQTAQCSQWSQCWGSSQDPPAFPDTHGAEDTATTSWI